jgi:hypothetical protein
MNPLQSRILFLLSEERNKCNVCFFPQPSFRVAWSVSKHPIIVDASNVSRKDLCKFTEILSAEKVHPTEISQILRHVLRFEKENCEGRSSLGFSQDGAGGFFPVRICVFAMEALKKKIFSTLLRHVPQGGGLG